MLVRQNSLPLSPYSGLYDIVVSKDHFLRRMLELVNFKFVWDELQGKYCHTNGRNATDPIRLFKYLLLKVIYQLSDEDVVERSMTDMAFKFFLEMAPEEDVIHPSLLTKFRKLRLKDSDLLNLLIQKSVQIAIEQGVINSTAAGLIVDSTHSGSRYNQKSPQEHLNELAKRVRRTVYKYDETAKERMPKKIESKELVDVIEYVQSIVKVVEKEAVAEMPDVKTRLNFLKEVITEDLEHMQEMNNQEDVQVDNQEDAQPVDNQENTQSASNRKTAQSVNDKDARVGHKTADTSYFGYKTHIGMSKERIILSAIVTSGEKNDGKQLQELIELAEKNGIKLKSVIGDMAYSESANIKYTTMREMQLISRLSKTVTHGNQKNGDKFEYNKDADRYVCQAGHMSYKKTSSRPKKHAEDGEGTVESYWFDVEKCKDCPFREGCYKEGSKSKSYSVSIKSNTHLKQAEFQETEEFKEEAKNRYMIEAKNSELKNAHGFNRANSAGLLAMELQAAATLFAVNIKRIMKLIDAK